VLSIDMIVLKLSFTSTLYSNFLLCGGPLSLTLMYSGLKKSNLFMKDFPEF